MPRGHFKPSSRSEERRNYERINEENDRTFAIAVVLVFIEGMFPEKKRTKALPYRYRTKAVN